MWSMSLLEERSFLNNLVLQQDCRRDRFGSKLKRGVVIS